MKTIFHIVNNVCVKAEAVQAADSHFIQDYSLEDVQNGNLKYDTGS